MESKSINEKVKCCCCEGKCSGNKSINCIALPYKATWKFPTMGNVLTGQSGQAVAYVCDECWPLLMMRPPFMEILFAVEFQGEQIVYHDVKTLTKI